MPTYRTPASTSKKLDAAAVGRRGRLRCQLHRPHADDARRRRNPAIVRIATMPLEFETVWRPQCQVRRHRAQHPRRAGGPGGPHQPFCLLRGEPLLPQRGPCTGAVGTIRHGAGQGVTGGLAASSARTSRRSSCHRRRRPHCRRTTTPVRQAPRSALKPATGSRSSISRRATKAFRTTRTSVNLIRRRLPPVPADVDHYDYREADVSTRRRRQYRRDGLVGRRRRHHGQLQADRRHPTVPWTAAPRRATGLQRHQRCSETDERQQQAYSSDIAGAWARGSRPTRRLASTSWSGPERRLRTPRTCRPRRRLDRGGQRVDPGEHQEPRRRSSTRPRPPWPSSAQLPPSAAIAGVYARVTANKACGAPATSACSP